MQAAFVAGLSCRVASGRVFVRIVFLHRSVRRAGRTQRTVLAPRHVTGTGEGGLFRRGTAASTAAIGAGRCKLVVALRTDASEAFGLCFGFGQQRCSRMQERGERNRAERREEALSLSRSCTRQSKRREIPRSPICAC